jgi:hypothetical protein
MRRIMLVVTVWLVMAAMMVILAIPVLAVDTGNQKGAGNQGPPISSGDGNPDTSSRVVHSQDQGGGACVRHRNSTQPEDLSSGCFR